MLRLDNIVVGLFQRVYDGLLDRLGARIGTFRMGLALTPIVADSVARLAGGGPMSEVLANGIFLVGIGLFYDVRTMLADDRRQERRDLTPINAPALRFQADFLALRIFYLFALTAAALVHHNCGGLGLLAIVYARCLTVRDRIEPKDRRTIAFQPT